MLEYKREREEKRGGGGWRVMQKRGSDTEEQGCLGKRKRELI